MSFSAADGAGGAPAGGGVLGAKRLTPSKLIELQHGEKKPLQSVCDTPVSPDSKQCNPTWGQFNMWDLGLTAEPRRLVPHVFPVLVYGCVAT